jgi:hypothetical protein
MFIASGSRAGRTAAPPVRARVDAVDSLAVNNDAALLI